MEICENRADREFGPQDEMQPKEMISVDWVWTIARLTVRVGCDI